MLIFQLEKMKTKKGWCCKKVSENSYYTKTGLLRVSSLIGKN